MEAGTAMPVEERDIPFHGEVTLYRYLNCREPLILKLAEKTLDVTENICYHDTILGLDAGSSFKSFKFGRINPDTDPTVMETPRKFGGYVYSTQFCGNMLGSATVTIEDDLSACMNVYREDKKARSFKFYRL
jgi:hypothetical protein